jgi:polar amino acid transport system substrate-binding protein
MEYGMRRLMRLPFGARSRRASVREHNQGSGSITKSTTQPQRNYWLRFLCAVVFTAYPIAGGAQKTALPPPGTVPHIDAIRARGVLRVAVVPEAPWLLKPASPSKGELAGPAWTLAEAFAKRLGVKLQVVSTTAADKVAILNRDDAVDLTIAPLLHTAARSSQAELIDYSETAQCLFGLRSNRKLQSANGIGDLNVPAVTIATIKGTPQEQWLKQLLPLAHHIAFEGTIADIPTKPIVDGTADIAPIDKYFWADAHREIPELATFPVGADCLASQAMLTPISMAVAKGQTGFAAWLRSVAAEASVRLKTQEAERLVLEQERRQQ